MIAFSDRGNIFATVLASLKDNIDNIIQPNISVFSKQNKYDFAIMDYPLA